MGNPQTCILCKNWWIEFDEGWSEWTPGYGFRSGCRVGIWEADGGDVSTSRYRKCMLLAETCEKYDEVENDR